MEDLDLVGVRFSSAKPPNPTWIAWGTERGGALVVDGVDHVGATLAERLARGTPRVLGVDVPFGLPAALGRSFVPLVSNGWQVLEHLVVTPGAALDLAWAEWAAANPGALRFTDALSHGAPSVTDPRPPQWRRLRALARILWDLRDRVALVPFDSLELSPVRPMVLETLPAVLLRILGLPLAWHQSDPARYDSVAHTAARLEVLRRLPEALNTLGFRMEIPGGVANAAAHDKTGDAIDAVLSLVSAYLATRGLWTPPPITGPHAPRVLVEGWIVRPG